jgi:hypothetical protein
MCRRPAARLIDREVFCEGQRELIIEAAGVDRFRTRRLTAAERAFQSGGRISGAVAVKRRREDPMAKSFDLSTETGICCIPVQHAVYCRNCLTVSNSRPDQFGLCRRDAVLRLGPVLKDDPDPPVQGCRPVRLSFVSPPPSAGQTRSMRCAPSRIVRESG